MAKDLTIYLSPMSEIENFNYSTGVINRINDSIIANADTVELGIAKFPASMRTGMISQGEDLPGYAILQNGREFSELMFGRGDNPDAVFHQFLRSFLISARKLRKGRALSWLRASAMARSIKSSLNVRSFTILVNMTSCSAEGRAWNAVMKTSATASLVVMGISSFLYGCWISVNLLTSLRFSYMFIATIKIIPFSWRKSRRFVEEFVELN